jgi:hypothetical protein
MRATGEFTSVYSFFALDDTGFGQRQPCQAVDAAEGGAFGIIAAT